MSTELNSDEMGAAGEHDFAALCTKSKLVANSSHRDRRGWDFILEWPHQGGDLPLDARPAPISCLVQLKSVKAHTARIKVRLSSIEYLAKELKPSFIVVFVYSDDLKLLSYWVGHLADKLIAEVLRRLRVAQRDGLKPNEIEFFLSLKKWFVEYSCSEDIRSIFEKAIGEGIKCYIDNKSDQINSLGFEGARLQFQGNFHFEDEFHMVDTFLGLREADVASLSATETRFSIGLDRPDYSSDSGKVRVEPNSHDRGKIFFLDEKGVVVSALQAKVYRSGIQVGNGLAGIRFDTKYFQFVVYSDGRNRGVSRCKLVMNWNLIYDEKRTIKAHNELFEFLSRLRRGGAGLWLSVGRKFKFEIVGVNFDATNPLGLDRVEAIQGLLRSTQVLMDKGKIDLGRVSLQRIVDQRRAIDFLNKLMLDTHSGAELILNLNPNAEIPASPINTTLILYFTSENSAALFCFTAKAELGKNGEIIQCRIYDLSYIGADRSRLNDSEFKKRTERWREITGIEGTMHIDIGGFLSQHS